MPADLDPRAPAPGPGDAVWEALRPFADILKGNLHSQRDDMQLVFGPNEFDLRFACTVGDLRRARAAIEPRPALDPLISKLARSLRDITIKCYRDGTRSQADVDETERALLQAIGDLTRRTEARVQAAEVGQSLAAATERAEKAEAALADARNAALEEAAEIAEGVLGLNDVRCRVAAAIRAARTLGDAS